GGGCADRCANEARLGNGSVKHAVAPELLNQSLGHAEYTAPGVFALKTGDSSPTCDILAQQNNAGVAAHLQAHRFVDRLGIRHLTNCDSHYLLLYGMVWVTGTSHRHRSGPLPALDKAQTPQIPRQG